MPPPTRRRRKGRSNFATPKDSSTTRAARPRWSITSTHTTSGPVRSRSLRRTRSRCCGAAISISRASAVSLVLTLSVLGGLVVAIYQMFPARHNELAQQAVAHHREPPAWDLPAPSQDQLQAFLIGAAGKGAPLPAATALGASRLDVLDRLAALIRFKLGT